MRSLTPSDECVREAYLYDALEGGKVRCNTCNRRCIIPAGELGFCETRKNWRGNLYTLEYGLVSSLTVNPIEKKPLFHFWPGSTFMTVGSWSCTFTCPWCQNYRLSKCSPEVGRDQSSVLSPEALVDLTLQRGCKGTSMSFSEPTTFLEYSVDVFKRAKRKNLYNTVITNGYFTSEALDLFLKAGADAFNIDIKGGLDAVKRYCKADGEHVWQNAIQARRKGAWVELTTLVIPGVNDDEGGLREIAQRIRRDIGPETPWHVSRYFPHYQFTTPQTPMSTLQKAYTIGKEEGLRFVYVGNVPGHPYEDTFCPSCGELLIDRRGLTISDNNLADNHCPECGEAIPIIGEISTATSFGFF
jgi:pyruvate formate lyase activating enzyme